MKFYVSFCGFEPGGIIMPVEARLAQPSDRANGMWTYILEAANLNQAVEIATNMYVTELNQMWEDRNK